MSGTGPKQRTHGLLAAGVLLPMLALAGCRDGQYLGRRDTVTFNAGDAVAHNKAVHTIDPWPPHSRNTRLTTDGKRMLIGVGRYQSNQSIEPRPYDTNKAFGGKDTPPPPPPPTDGNGSSR